MRMAILSLGVMTLGIAWLGPLPSWAQHSFAAHMSLHMLVVALAAPLLALGMAGSCIDPVRRYPQLFPAVIASIVELGVVWLWHAPALHHLARHGTAGFVIEQSTFLLSGWWLWMSALGEMSWFQPDQSDPIVAPNRRVDTRADAIGGRRAAGVLALLLTSMHMTLLGALLLLSPRLLFAAHQHEPGPTHPLLDQQMGGCIMLIGGGLAYLVGGLGLIMKLLSTKTLQRTRTS